MQPTNGGRWKRGGAQEQIVDKLAVVEGKLADMQKHVADVEPLEAELAAAEAELAAAEARSSELERQHASLQEDLSAQNEKLAESDAALEASKANFAASEAQLAELQKQHESELTDEKSRAAEEVSSATSALERSDAAKFAAKAQVSELEQQNACLHADAAAVEAVLQHVQQELDDTVQLLHETEQEAQAATLQDHHSSEELEELRSYMANAHEAHELAIKSNEAAAIDAESFRHEAAQKLENSEKQLEVEQTANTALLQEHHALVDERKRAQADFRSVIQKLEEDRSSLAESQNLHELVIERHEAALNNEATARHEAEQTLGEVSKELVVMLRKHHANEDERKKTQAENQGVLQELQEHRSAMADARELHNLAIERHEAALKGEATARQEAERKLADTKKQLEAEQAAIASVLQEHHASEDEKKQMQTDNQSLSAELGEYHSSLARAHTLHTVIIEEHETALREEATARQEAQQKLHDTVKELEAEQAAKVDVLHKYRASEDDGKKMQMESRSLSAELEEHRSSLARTQEMHKVAVKKHDTSLKEEAIVRQDALQKLQDTVKELQAEQAAKVALLDKYRASEDDGKKMQMESRSLSAELEEHRSSLVCAQELRKVAMEKQDAALKEEAIVRQDAQQKLQHTVKELEAEQAAKVALLDKYRASEDDGKKIQMESRSLSAELEEHRSSLVRAQELHKVAMEKQDAALKEEAIVRQDAQQKLQDTVKELEAEQAAKVALVEKYRASEDDGKKIQMESRSLSAELEEHRSSLARVQEMHKVAIEKHDTALKEEAIVRQDAQQNLQDTLRELEAEQAARAAVLQEHHASEDERLKIQVENRTISQELQEHCSALAHAHESHSLAMETHEATLKEHATARQEAELKLQDTVKELEAEQAAKVAVLDKYRASEDDGKKVQELHRSVLQELEDHRSSLKDAGIDAKEIGDAEAILKQEEPKALARDAIAEAMAKDPVDVKAIQTAIDQAKAAKLEAWEYQECEETLRREEEKAKAKAKEELKKVLESIRDIDMTDMAVISAAKAKLSTAINTAKECSVAEQDLHDFEMRRRRLHNTIEDLKGSIRVFCRIRPLSKRETDLGASDCTAKVDLMTVSVTNQQVRHELYPGSSHTPVTEEYMFDAVFKPGSQEEVYEECRDLVQSACDGYNITLFAYGQTGAGKTYTMGGTPENPGVSRRTINEIFRLTAEGSSRYQYTVMGSVLELYCDDLVDLLAVARDPQAAVKKLAVRNDKSGIVINDLTEQECKSPEELSNVLEEAAGARKEMATKMNSKSSRSHLLFIVRIVSENRETRQILSGKVLIVDLAGSERLKQSGVTGKGAKEAIETNKGLTALGDVMEALTIGSKHIPYRNSKLTMVMADALGGSAKTLMFVNISPASSNADQTTMALKWATRAKKITNNAVKRTG